MFQLFLWKLWLPRVAARFLDVNQPPKRCGCKIQVGLVHSFMVVADLGSAILEDCMSSINFRSRGPSDVMLYQSKHTACEQLARHTRE